MWLNINVRYQPNALEKHAEKAQTHA
jgi:hypothetical protein